MIGTIRTHDGVDLRYDEAGSGPPVLLVHGLGLSRRRWQTQLAALAEAGYRAIRYDQRGFGDSALPGGPYGMDDLVADLLMVADELGLDDFHLVGHSMGGMVSLLFAIEHPSRVRTLTVASVTAHNGERATAFASGLARISELGFDEAVKEPQIRSMVEFVLAEAFGHDPTPIEHFRRGLEQPNPSHALAWRATERFSVRDEIGLIRCPVLVLHGTADPLIPFALGRWIAEAIEGAEFVPLEGAGHSVQVERPDEFNRALLAFLRREG